MLHLTALHTGGENNVTLNLHTELCMHTHACIRAHRLSAVISPGKDQMQVAYTHSVKVSSVCRVQLHVVRSSSSLMSSTCNSQMSGNQFSAERPVVMTGPPLSTYLLDHHQQLRTATCRCGP